MVHHLCDSDEFHVKVTQVSMNGSEDSFRMSVSSLQTSCKACLRIPQKDFNAEKLILQSIMPTITELSKALGKGIRSNSKHTW